MLSSKQVEELQRMVTPNKDNAVEEDDVRALIYRESQLRKKAAAAQPAERMHRLFEDSMVHAQQRYT